MRVLIDIGHPAHVHLFRNFASDMVHNGHEILFTCREKEFEIDLLKHYKLPYISLGRKSGSVFSKFTGLIIFESKLLSAAKRFNPDIFLSHGSHYAAHIAFLTGKPHIALEDTFNFEQIWLYKPFTSAILTSDYDHPLRSQKLIKYSGYHELAYLHPAKFTPDISVLNDLGVQANEKYVIMRFVSWKASHDIGHKGISLEYKSEAVRQFSKYAKVFISSEAELPPKLKPYQIKVSPHRIHDAIACATFLFGESSTMAEESAMLGIPSIYLNNNSTNYTKHLEDGYQLIFNYSESIADQYNAIQRGLELLNNPHLKTEWQLRRRKMLSEKINVTAFLTWFIEYWPDSFGIMKENPDYQLKFK